MICGLITLAVDAREIQVSWVDHPTVAPGGIFFLRYIGFFTYDDCCHGLRCCFNARFINIWGTGTSFYIFTLFLIPFSKTMLLNSPDLAFVEISFSHYNSPRFGTPWIHRFVFASDCSSILLVTDPGIGLDVVTICDLVGLKVLTDREGVVIDVVEQSLPFFTGTVCHVIHHCMYCISSKKQR